MKFICKMYSTFISGLVIVSKLLLFYDAVYTQTTHDNLTIQANLYGQACTLVHQGDIGNIKTIFLCLFIVIVVVF